MGGTVNPPRPFSNDNILGLFSTVTGLYHDYNIYKTISDDFGTTWPYPDTIDIESISVNRAAGIDTLIYFLGVTRGTFKNSFFMRSFDNAVSWYEYHEFEESDIGYIGKGTLSPLGDSVFITYYVGSRENVDVDSIIFSFSENRGESWTDVRGIINMYSDMYHHWFRISQNRMHLVFQDFNQGLIDIYYSFSDDFGLTWSDPVFISDNDNYSSQWPYLSADTSANLCISWFDYKYGGGFTGELLYRISHNNGETWGLEKRLTYDQNCTVSLSIINNDYIAFIWADHYFGLFHANLSFKESYDSGNTWSNKVELTNNGPEHNIFAPEALFYNDNIYLFWQDDRDGSLFNYEIYFKSGEITTTEVTNSQAIPEDFGITSIYPNPFNSKALINVLAKQGDRIGLSVYDICGKRLKTLIEGYTNTNNPSFIWDGTNFENDLVASGVYFIRFESNDRNDVRKAVFLK
jgi:hypothetical protein